MKVCHNVLYTVDKKILLKIALTILMRYMFLYESKRLQHTKNIPCQNINVAQEEALSYVGPSLWNNLNKALKPSTSLNAFKHNIKQHYFNELKKRLSNSLHLFDVSK